MTRLAILTYHSLDDSGSVISVTPRVFADQMACLADEGVYGVTLRDAVAYRDLHGSWPAHRVVLAFDDGYANFADVALPILQRHAFRATVFLVTRHVGGHNDWAPPPAGVGTQPLLAWAQAIELTAAGLEIGAHTRTHRDLRRLDAAAARDEISGARQDIEDRVGVAVESFAYPFGHRAWTDLVAREYHAGCTTELRRAGHHALHELPRIDMFYIRTPRRLVQLVRGRLDGWLSVRRWGRAVRQALATGPPAPARRV